jgi:hypothetical protein
MVVSPSSSSSSFQIKNSSTTSRKFRGNPIYRIYGVLSLCCLIFVWYFCFSSSRSDDSDNRSQSSRKKGSTFIDSSLKIFHDKYPRDLIGQIQDYRYVRIVGWSFCQSLEGATFDAFTNIYSLGGSIASINPTSNQIIKIIETEARNIFKRLDVILEDKGVDHLDLWRFSCHFAADGLNSLTNITDSRFVHNFEAKNYFPFLSFVENDWKSRDTLAEVDFLYSSFRTRTNVNIQT